MRSEKKSIISGVRRKLRRASASRPGGDEIEDVDAGARRAVGDLDERAGHQRHQVGRLRELERVVPAHALAGQLAALAQDAVRQHEVARRRRADHLGRELLDRVIDAGPVVARVVVLPLRPALQGGARDGRRPGRRSRGRGAAGRRSGSRPPAWRLRPRGSGQTTRSFSPSLSKPAARPSTVTDSTSSSTASKVSAVEADRAARSASASPCPTAACAPRSRSHSSRTCWRRAGRSPTKFVRVPGAAKGRACGREDVTAF